MEVPRSRIPYCRTRRGVLLGVDCLEVETGRVVSVLLGDLLEAAAFHVGHEGADLDVLVRVAGLPQQLQALRGEGEELVLRQVEAPVVAIAEVVQQSENAQGQDHAETGGGQVAQAPAAGAGDDEETGQGDGGRVEDHGDPEDPLRLRLGQGDGVEARVPGPDRDQALVLGEPAHRVQGQVSVALGVEVTVAGEVGVAEDHEPSPAGGVGHRHAETDGSAAVGGVEAHGALAAGSGLAQHRQVRLGPAGGAGPGQDRGAGRDGGHRGGIEIDGAGQLVESHHAAAVVAGDGVLAVVGGDHGDGEVEAEEGTDAAGVDDEVVARDHAPLPHQVLETALLEGVGQQQQGAAAAEVAADGVDLVGQEGRPGAGDDQHPAVVGHPGLAGQEEGVADDVVDLAEAPGQPSQVGLEIAASPLAVAHGEADPLPPVPEDLEHGVGDLLLRELGDAQPLVAGGDHQRVVGADAVLLGPHRVAVGIDELEVEAPAAVHRVLLEQPPQLPVLSPFHEGEGLHVLLQGLQGLHRQGRQAVQPALGQVEPLGVAVGEEVHHPEDGQHQDASPEGVEPAAVLAEQVGVEHRRDGQQQRPEAGVCGGQPEGRGIEEHGQSGGGEQGRSGQAGEGRVGLHRRQRLDSRTRVVRKRQKKMKLR